MKKRNSKSRLPSTGKSGIWQWRTGPGVIKAVIGGTGRPIALPFLKEKTRVNASSDALQCHRARGPCFLLHLPFHCWLSPQLCPRIFGSCLLPLHTLSQWPPMQPWLPLPPTCWKLKYLSIEIAAEFWTMLSSCVLDISVFSSCSPEPSSCPTQLAAHTRNLGVIWELCF